METKRIIPKKDQYMDLIKQCKDQIFAEGGIRCEKITMRGKWVARILLDVEDIQEEQE